MKQLPKTITKRRLITAITKRLHNKLHQSYVADVVSLLVDEMIRDVRQNNYLNIGNFCSFTIEYSKPRKFYNVKKRRLAISQSKPQLKIKLSKSLRKIIINKLDLIKTLL